MSQFKIPPARRPWAALAAALLALASSLASGAPADPQLGSPNTAVADPPVPRPAGRSCSVTLFTDLTFADFSPKPFTYTPPASCPGPWAKVVFEADFSVTAGRQFDRTANIWIGGASVYFGTTAEPSSTVSPDWHVERDLTDYSALLTAPQSGQAILGNLVNTTYTGVIHGSARLQFYALRPRAVPPRVPDVVLPLSNGVDGGTVDLVTTSTTLARTFTLPTNVEAAALDVYVQSQSTDEFWYACVPDDVADQLFSCPGTAFREAQIALDGQPAGIAPVYPWIFTGGIDPYLWRPIPGVQTLSFVPYRADLTPFAGVLSDGAPHEIALSVFGAHNFFSGTAALLLYLDHGSTQITGGVLSNTLSAAPDPQVEENLTTTDGVTSGTVAVRSGRDAVLAGYVNTSHGRVGTRITQRVEFSNSQRFTISDTEYTQDILQHTRVQTTTSTHDRQGLHTRSEELSFPLKLDLSQLLNPDGTSSLTTTIRQGYESRERTALNGMPLTFRELSNLVTPTDTLLFNAAGGLAGRQDQASAQRYFARDSQGCYSRSIAAAGGVLTVLQDGGGCPHGHP